jgi:hypothetical protein
MAAGRCLESLRRHRHHQPSIADHGAGFDGAGFVHVFTAMHSSRPATLHPEIAYRHRRWDGERIHVRRAAQRPRRAPGHLRLSPARVYRSGHALLDAAPRSEAGWIRVEAPVTAGAGDAICMWTAQSLHSRSRGAGEQTGAGGGAGGSGSFAAKRTFPVVPFGARC